jgi:hypothetical protein
VKKGMEDPDHRKKDEEKKDHHKKKEKKEDEPEIKIGLDVEVEGPKVIKRPPKRGGCTSSDTSGVIGPKIKVKPKIEIEPGDRKKEYEVVVTRPVKEGKVIGPDDVEEREVSRKGRRALDRSQVVGRRASRDIRASEIMNQGMTK